MKLPFINENIFESHKSLVESEESSYTWYRLMWYYFFSFFYNKIGNNFNIFLLKTLYKITIMISLCSVYIF